MADNAQRRSKIDQCKQTCDVQRHFSKRPEWIYLEAGSEVVRLKKGGGLELKITWG
jgi:hypothetical protein